MCEAISFPDWDPWEVKECDKVFLDFHSLHFQVNSPKHHKFLTYTFQCPSSLLCPHNHHAASFAAAVILATVTRGHCVGNSSLLLFPATLSECGAQPTVVWRPCANSGPSLVSEVATLPRRHLDTDCPEQRDGREEMEAYCLESAGRRWRRVEMEYRISIILLQCRLNKWSSKVNLEPKEEFWGATHVSLSPINNLFFHNF